MSESADFIRQTSEPIHTGRQVGPHTVDDLRERWSTKVRVVCQRCGQWWREGGYYPEECRALGPTEGSALLTGNTPKGSIESVDSLSDETPDARESPTIAMDAPAYHGDGQASQSRSPRNVASERGNPGVPGGEQKPQKERSGPEGWEPLTREADTLFTWHSRFNLAEIQSEARLMPNPLIGRGDRRHSLATIDANVESVRSFLADILFGRGDYAVMRRIPADRPHSPPKANAPSGANEA